MKKLFMILMCACAVFAAVPVAACDADPGCTCQENILYPYTRFTLRAYIIDGYYFIAGRSLAGKEWDPSQESAIPTGFEVYKSEEKDVTYYLGFRHDCDLCPKLDCGSAECKHLSADHICNPVYFLVVSSYDNLRIATYDPVTVKFQPYSLPSGVKAYYPAEVTTVDGEKILLRDSKTVPDIIDLLSNRQDIAVTGGAFTFSRNTPVSFKIPSDTTEARLEYAHGESSDYNVAYTVTNPQYYGEKTYIFGRQPLQKLPEGITGSVSVRAYHSNGITEGYTDRIWIKLDTKTKGLK